MSSRTIRVVAPLLTLGLIGVAAVVFLGPLSNAQSKTEEADQAPTERTVSSTIPAHIPIRVQLKKDKESRVKALSNEKWASELELEITNTSKKPIYYVGLWISLPEVKMGGVKVIFAVRYGRIEFVYPETLPTKDDIPIQPDETVTVKIPKATARSWEANRAAGRLEQALKLEFDFVHLSFGDGTGIDGTGNPYPNPDVKASNICPEPPNPAFTSLSILNIPALSPVSFFLPMSFGLAAFPISTTSSPDLCCPGTPCSKRIPAFYTCECVGRWAWDVFLVGLE